MPRRIQRKRTKVWRMPEGAVYVGRGSRWGNPWRVGDVVRVEWAPSVEITPRLAVELYRTAYTPAADIIRDALRGKDLACWCPLDQPCHADVLLGLANGGESS